MKSLTRKNNFLLNYVFLALSTITCVNVSFIGLRVPPLQDSWCRKSSHCWWYFLKWRIWFATANTVKKLWDSESPLLQFILQLFIRIKLAHLFAQGWAITINKLLHCLFGHCMNISKAVFVLVNRYGKAETSSLAVIAWFSKSLNQWYISQELIGQVHNTSFPIASSTSQFFFQSLAESLALKMQ